MKRLLIILVLLAVSAHAADTYSAKIRFVLEQLRQEKNASGEPLIAGRSENYGGRNGAFFLLAPFVLEWATKEDVVLMLVDSSPIVRVLGAKRVLTPTVPVFRPEALDRLLKDETKVVIGPLDEEGDTYRIMTVGEVIGLLKNDPRFLPLELEEKRPNSERSDSP